jgi:predicted nucleic acid-binding protein
VTAIDTNILVDLLVSEMPEHKSTTEAMRQLSDEICTTPTNIGECLRLLTHSRLFPKPLTITSAVEALNELFGYYRIKILEEDVNWWKHLPEIEKEIPALRGNEIFDARIALCLRSNNVRRIHTRDADFKKYSFLQPIRPLSSMKNR